jgi:anthranilate/para-aminobenzoate synthase component I
MIVDLVRNDLGRVCTPGSISVPELMKIETYAAVFQMVSTVTGELATGRDAFDLVRATFPPGSMTGAPKIAAIQLLEELESVRRGVYAGALGYFDVRGGLDLSVVIRTLVVKDGRAHLHVGGGIVADSKPEAEYVESLDKAKAPLDALTALNGLTALGGLTALSGPRAASVEKTLNGQKTLNSLTATSAGSGPTNRE